MKKEIVKIDGIEGYKASVVQWSKNDYSVAVVKENGHYYELCEFPELHNFEAGSQAEVYGIIERQIRPLLLNKLNPERKFYKAIVTDKETKKLVIIESEYENKTKFIRDLRGNGYAVNPYKVKLSQVFDHIMNNTDCAPWDWKKYNTLEDIKK